MTKKKKRRIKFGGILVLVLSIYLVGTIFYLVWKMPIKRVIIEGNFYLKDNYLKDYLDLEGKSIISTSKSSIKNKLLEQGLISDASIKKNYLGTLYINIKEDKILFYNLNTKKIVLSSGKEIDNNNEYLGVPTLINYVPDTILDELINKFNRIDRENITLISEIEYSPSIINEKIVDENRFLFRMNDGNVVYINTINIEKFNNYLEIYEALINKNGDIRGCLYLDSNSDNKHFNVCDEVKNRGSNGTS